jgi:hypothetical protein
MSTARINVDECVVLLHGLVRTDASLNKMASALSSAGYATININYPSTKQCIESLADRAVNSALSQCPNGAKVHFVTHSLGGILVRQYLSVNTIENLGRVVMLGPPNQGSEIVDSLKNVPGFERIHGVAGVQLGTDGKSVPNILGPANFEVGIIAGTRSVNPILSTMISGKDDGKVGVDRTKLVGMTDHISLPVTHPFMMRNKTVIRQVIHFLKNGQFE